MDCREVLESIARLLPSAPEVEDQLVAFDSLVGVSEPEHRRDAARMLREAASACGEEERRERLTSAAEAVAEGRPCAFTPEGLTAQQAAAAQTVTLAEWEERMARAPLPPPAGESDSAEDEEEEDESDFLEAAPPKLPHLPVRYFFGGLVVRVAQGFVDTQGRVVCPGEVLRLLDCKKSETGYVLSVQVRTVRLAEGDAIHDVVTENAGNGWLEPVPSLECLRGLWEAADGGLAEAEEDEKMDDHAERLERLREDLDACAEWLDREEPGGAPECRSAGLAARVFGRDHAMTCWTRLLFAGVSAAGAAASGGE